MTKQEETTKTLDRNQPASPWAAALNKLREWDPVWAEQAVKITTNSWAAGTLPGPVLIAGDLNLNAAEGEAAVALERTEFRDGVGLPDVRTRPGRNVFDQGRSIDWIFLSGGLNGRNGRIHRNVRASDHFPVSAEVSFR
jgi:endonuclease/exonuclease/phosphatase family metal-dependent hydrolase